MRLPAVALLLAGLACVASAQTTSTGTKWDYIGKYGPINWGKLDPAFKACSVGKEQSPVDIRNAKLNKALQPIEFHYMAGPAEMVNNGAQLEAGESEAIVAFLTERHGLVNVNTAAAEELVALGLSEKDAGTIVSYRTDKGPFADFAALRGVPGLDVDRLDAVRQQMAFRD